MKGNLFFSVLILLAGLSACKNPSKGKNGVVYKNAVEYNDYIVNRQTSLMKKMLDFSKIAGDAPDSAIGMIEIYVQETDSMLTELKGMPPFNKDSSLRDAAISSFTFYKKVFGEDFKSILNIRENADLSADDADKAMNEIVDRMSAEEEKYDDLFQRAQKKFADKNNMQLRENSIQKEVNKLNE